MDNYVVYTRKSTDTEDRQVLSLDSQKRDVTEKIIIPNSIKPIAWFEESRSAKTPGRPFFDEMIKIIESGKVNIIITWHINRLARNPVDGGKLTWLVQNKRLKIITPTKTYNENDIFILYVEFGMANQFSNDLSKTVKRGLSDKVRLGIAPVYAPIGYLNDTTKPKGLKDILPDKERFDKVRKMWNLLLTGQYTPALIYKIVSEQWQLKHKNGKLLSRTQTYKLFHNIFYTGEYYYSGEIRQGIHKPMVTMTEFEEAQRILKLRGKSGVTKHETTYAGVLKCPCSASITTQVKPRMICPNCHKKFNPQHNDLCPQCLTKKDKMDVPLKIYVYLRCSRQINRNCKQPAVAEKEFEKQISEELMNIKLPEEFIEWGKKYLKDTCKNQANQNGIIEETIKRQLTLEKQKLQNLLDKYIDPENKNGEIISGNDYKHKKTEIVKKIALLEDQIKNAGQEFDYSADSAKKTFNFSKRARYWFENGSREQKRIILTTLDSNPILDTGLLRLNLLKPFEYIKDARKEIEEEKLKIEPKLWQEAMIQKYYLRLDNSLVSGIRELNPFLQLGKLTLSQSTNPAL